VIISVGRGYPLGQLLTGTERYK